MSQFQRDNTSTMVTGLSRNLDKFKTGHSQPLKANLRSLKASAGLIISAGVTTKKVFALKPHPGADESRLICDKPPSIETSPDITSKFFTSVDPWCNEAQERKLHRFASSPSISDHQQKPVRLPTLNHVLPACGLDLSDITKPLATPSQTLANGQVPHTANQPINTESLEINRQVPRTANQPRNTESLDINGQVPHTANQPRNTESLAVLKVVGTKHLLDNKKHHDHILDVSKSHFLEPMNSKYSPMFKVSTIKDDHGNEIGELIDLVKVKF